MSCRCWWTSFVLVGLVMAAASAQVSTTNLRVRVTLKNGSRLVGIVKGGNLYEVPGEGGRYLRADGPDVPGSGMRLWYVYDVPGYVFVPHKSIREFDRLSVVTPMQLLEFEKNLRESALIVLPKHRIRAEPANEETVEGVEGEFPREGEQPVDLSEEEAAEVLDRPLTLGEALLMRFPPDQGWLPERRDEIEKRKWVVGVFPTPEEKAFLENYTAWKEAYDAWLLQIIAERAAKNAEGAAPSTEPSRNKKPSGKRNGERPKSSP